MTWKLLVPIGISFYTFKSVSYVIEIYRKGFRPKTESRNPGSLYLVFPPGPGRAIDRPNDLIPQLRRPGNPILTISLRAPAGSPGACLKSGRSRPPGLFCGFVFDSPAYQGLNLIFAAYLFAFQIYCDFSGYSDIAVGLARILGVDWAKLRPPLSQPQREPVLGHMAHDLVPVVSHYLFVPICYRVMRRIRRGEVWGIKAETWGYGLAIVITMTLFGTGMARPRPLSSGAPCSAFLW